MFFTQASIANWRKVWYVTIAVLFAETTFYLIFASGEEQSWNKKYVTHSSDEVNQSLKNIQTGIGETKTDKKKEHQP